MRCGRRASWSKASASDVASKRALQLKTDRTRPQPLREKTKGAEAVLAVDLDHDGLLDLVVANKADASVWRNTGRKEFVDVTPRSGVAAPAAGRARPKNVPCPARWPPSISITIATQTWLLTWGATRRESQFVERPSARAGFEIHRLANKDGVLQQAVAAAVLDADANGSCDVLAAGPGGIALLQTSSTDYGQVDVINVGPVADFAANQLLVLDYDNDGSQDVLAANADTEFNVCTARAMDTSRSRRTFCRPVSTRFASPIAATWTATATSTSW